MACARNRCAAINSRYVEADHLNTPRQVTRPSDNKQMWTWFSDPFGTTAANSNPSGGGTFIYNVRFPGQIYDSQAGLQQNYFRDYDPQTGRYIESDLIGLRGGSYSPYAYASDDPIIYIDPWGLCWLYIQSKGQLLHVDANGYADYAAAVYSGYGAGVNNPAMQNVPNIGPIPQGNYGIGPQQDNDNGTLPASLRLTPNRANEMFNRFGFLIHGPHANDHQDSSNGCPVFSRSVRDKVGDSGDTCLQVVQ